MVHGRSITSLGGTRWLLRLCCLHGYNLTCNCAYAGGRGQMPPPQGALQQGREFSSMQRDLPSLLLNVTLHHALQHHARVRCVMLVLPIAAPPPPHFGVAEFKNEGFTRGWGA